MSTHEPDPLPGRLGNLIPEQLKVLEQFRAELTKKGWIVSEREKPHEGLHLVTACSYILDFYPYGVIEKRTAK